MGESTNDLLHIARRPTVGGSAQSRPADRAGAEEADALAPARGFIVAIGLSAIVWPVIAVAAWLSK